MAPNQNISPRIRMTRVSEAKLDRANKPKAPARLVLPKPVRVPAPPNQGSSR